jgi:hypothetical protein
MRRVRAYRQDKHLIGCRSSRIGHASSRLRRAGGVADPIRDGRS